MSVQGSVRINRARVRLEAIALKVGDLFAAGLDPGWDEQTELEQAAIEFRKAVRAQQAQP